MNRERLLMISREVARPHWKRDELGNVYFDVVGNAYALLAAVQAEDGIRDYKVTGVQTCALPIVTL